MQTPSLNIRPHDHEDSRHERLPQLNTLAQRAVLLDAIDGAVRDRRLAGRVGALLRDLLWRQYTSWEGHFEATFALQYGVSDRTIRRWIRAAEIAGFLHRDRSPTHRGSRLTFRAFHPVDSAIQTAFDFPCAQAAEAHDGLRPVAPTSDAPASDARAPGMLSTAVASLYSELNDDERQISIFLEDHGIVRGADHRAVLRFPAVEVLWVLQYLSGTAWSIDQLLGELADGTGRILARKHARLRFEAVTAETDTGPTHVDRSAGDVADRTDGRLDEVETMPGPKEATRYVSLNRLPDETQPLPQYPSEPRCPSEPHVVYGTHVTVAVHRGSLAPDMDDRTTPLQRGTPVSAPAATALLRRTPMSAAQRSGTRVSSRADLPDREDPWKTGSDRSSQRSLDPRSGSGAAGSETNVATAAAARSEAVASHHPSTRVAEAHDNGVAGRKTAATGLRTPTTQRLRDLGVRASGVLTALASVPLAAVEAEVGVLRARGLDPAAHPGLLVHRLRIAQQPSPAVTGDDEPSTLPSDNVPDTNERLWNAVLERVAAASGGDACALLETAILMRDDARVVVGAANVLVRDWLAHSMLPALSSALEAELGHPVTLDLVVDPDCGAGKLAPALYEQRQTLFGSRQNQLPLPLPT